MNDSNQPLEKTLGFFDVYALATGAMFASGFFLLPGLAAARSGPSVVLAYGIASVLMVPAALAIAELSTTMPRAGGPYYFLDRSFGPAVGTIGGLGVWGVLILKSAFALVGMGAYLNLAFDFSIEWIAIAMTVVFAGLNLIGAKEGALLQRVLVSALLALMLVFVLSGLVWIGQAGFATRTRQQMSPFLPFGAGALFSTVAMVFVSFAGLTKVASVSEEVARPERNLPLGMITALLSVTVVYVVGIYAMVAVLPADTLRQDLTPVATASRQILDWLPGSTGFWLILIGAVAAFASTGNAGLLGASRIPLAMARDGLVWEGFSRVGRWGTPGRAIVVTAGLMIAVILVLDAEGLAKLASAFLLFVLVLLNLAVIVMRESRIESYVPVFRVPGYPWIPLAGLLSGLILIVLLGWLYVLFLGIVILLSWLWFRLAVSKHVDRRGAVYNVFARLAKYKHEPLEEEMWDLLQERGPSEEDLYDEVLARGVVIDYRDPVAFERVVEEVAERLAAVAYSDADQLAQSLRTSGGAGGPPIADEAVLIDVRSKRIQHPHVALVRLRAGWERKRVRETVGDLEEPSTQPATPVIHAALFLVSPESQENQHLRILGALGARITEPGFLELWQSAETAQQLREIFLRTDRFLLLRLHAEATGGSLIGARIGELSWPGRARVAALHRHGDPAEPDPETVLQAGDRLTIVGDPDDIAATYRRFGPLASSSDDHA